METLLQVKVKEIRQYLGPDQAVLDEWLNFEISKREEKSEKVIRKLSLIKDASETLVFVSCLLALAGFLFYMGMGSRAAFLKQQITEEYVKEECGELLTSKDLLITKLEERTKMQSTASSDLYVQELDNYGNKYCTYVIGGAWKEFFDDSNGKSHHACIK